MDIQRLAKVLALAASDNEAEAVGALRTANRLLEAAGQDFVALAARLTAPPDPADYQAVLDEMDDALLGLRTENHRLRTENQRLRDAALPHSAAPSTLAAAAQDAAAAIRLRAEVTLLAEALQVAATESLRAQAAEAELSTRLAQAELDLSDARSRHGRLSAELRRLSHINLALKAELDELHRQPPPLAAKAETKPRRRGPSRRAKAAQLAQYVLL